MNWPIPMHALSSPLAPRTASRTEGVDPMAGQVGEGNPTHQYLQHLAGLFPGSAWLTVPQVAVCLKLSAGHIYNLHSTGSLPFRMIKNQSGRLRASIHDIAAYMGDQQAQTLQGRRQRRGPRLRWVHAAIPHPGSGTATQAQKQGAHP